MIQIMKAGVALFCLLNLSTISFAALNGAGIHAAIERAVISQALQQKKQPTSEKILEAYSILEKNDLSALRKLLNAGVEINKYYSEYNGGTLLGLAIVKGNWSAVIYLLKQGGNIKQPLLQEFPPDIPDNLPIAAALAEALKYMEDIDVLNPDFWYCLLIAYYEGYPVSRVLDAPFLSNGRITQAYYTWTLVRDYNLPVVFAASFTNSVHLLQALDYRKADDKVVVLKADKNIPSMIDWYGMDRPQLVFNLKPGQATRPSEWVRKWRDLSAESLFPPLDDEGYLKLLKKFER